MLMRARILPLTSQSPVDQGYLEEQRVGDSVHAKHLKAKFESILPEGTHIIDFPAEAYLSHLHRPAPAPSDRAARPA